MSSSLVEQIEGERGLRHACRLLSVRMFTSSDLRRAREAGCDLVVSRGQFFSQLETILND